MFVCLLVCLLFIGHTTFVHYAALPPSGREQESRRRGRPRARGRNHAQREHARACRTTSQRKKIAALMPFKNKTVRARACCRIRNCRDFHKKGERKPTCHFPSSVYSLPSLGVCTFRIVRIVLDLWSEPTLVSSSIPIKEQCMFVCWFVGLHFIGHTRFPTLRRCLRVREQEPSGGPAQVPSGQACTARARARMPYNSLLNEKIVALMPFTNKTVRARMLPYT